MVTRMRVMIGQPIDGSSIEVDTSKFTNGCGAGKIDLNGNVVGVDSDWTPPSVDIGAAVTDNHLLAYQPLDADENTFVIGITITEPRRGQLGGVSGWFNGDILCDMTWLALANPTVMQKMLDQVRQHLESRNLPHDDVQVFVIAVPKI